MRQTLIKVSQIAACICIWFLMTSALEAQELKYGSEEFFVEIHGFFAQEYFDFQSDGKRNGTPSFDNHYFYLFINPRIRQNLWLETEIEYEHGGQKIELDRVELFWQIAESATVYMGRFYAPFGIERKYWYPSLNPLISRPMLSQVITLANWYSVGVGINGTIPLGTTTFNYDAALANGLTSPLRDVLHPGNVSLSPMRDNNADKALTGRIGFSPFQYLELGASFYTGKYDADERYRISFLGSDVDLEFRNLSLRGEYVWSPVETAQGDHRRSGFYLQIAYQLLKEHKYLNYLGLTARYDTLDLDRDDTNNEDLNRLTLGLNISPYPHFLFKIDYEIVTERAAPGLANNGIWIQAVLDF